MLTVAAEVVVVIAVVIVEKLIDNCVGFRLKTLKSSSDLVASGIVGQDLTTIVISQHWINRIFKDTSRQIVNFNRLGRITAPDRQMNAIRIERHLQRIIR